MKFLDLKKLKVGVRPLLGRIPGYLALRGMWFELGVLRYALRDGQIVRILRGTAQLKAWSRQAVLRPQILIQSIENAEQLKKWFNLHGVSYYEGYYTLYLPPQAGLETLFGANLGLYPEDAGLKILKTFCEPESAKYVTRTTFEERAYIRLVGTPQDQVDAANYLYMNGLGPRLYDLVNLDAGPVQMTAFVVQDMPGGPPSSEECRRFIDQLDQLIRSGDIAVIPPDWKVLPDFQCPSCNGNLLRDANGDQCLYVDFQNFVVKNPRKLVTRLLSEGKRDLHFGDEYRIRGGRYPYQSDPFSGVTGKRNTALRWQTFQRLLKEAGVTLQDRLVLDVGCNAGMIMAQALADGAQWALGWDRPNVIKHTRSLLLALGFTRFDLTSAELFTRYDLMQDIETRFHSMLPDAVLFYLAVKKHFGFLSGLATMPWNVMVYEGHEGERIDSLTESLEGLARLTEFDVIAATEFQDGDSGICIYKNKPHK